MIKILNFSSKKEIEKFLLKGIKIDKNSINIFLNKTKIYNIFIDKISNIAVNILKQNMLSIGGDVAVNKNVVLFEKGENSCLIFGTRKQIFLLIEKMKLQSFGLKNLAIELETIISDKNKKNNSPRIMGILNLTDDSFFDGGKYLEKKACFNRIDEIIKQGAEIIDIGAESSRPFSLSKKSSYEIEKISIALDYINKNYKNRDFLISLDTYKSDVAEFGCKRGVDIINDIYAGRFDKKMINVIKKYDKNIVLMHMKGDPNNMQNNPEYFDIIEEICDFFKERINFFVQNNINENRLILDPGIGFGKNFFHNQKILNNLEIFKSFGLSILVGISRKSFIGEILKNNINDRLYGTLALTAFLYKKNIDFIRVHDVKMNKEVIKILENLEF